MAATSVEKSTLEITNKVKVGGAETVSAMVGETAAVELAPAKKAESAPVPENVREVSGGGNVVQMQVEPQQEEVAGKVCRVDGHGMSEDEHCEACQ
jgi:hypothetical protein